MSLTVSKEAAKWYKRELELKNGDYLQFFVKLYGGIEGVHPNYSLGIVKGKNGDLAIQEIKEGITFYFNEQDAWYLKDFKMEIKIRKKELIYTFTKKER